jgi:hypothetical protein
MLLLAGSLPHAALAVARDSTIEGRSSDFQLTLSFFAWVAVGGGVVTLMAIVAWYLTCRKKSGIVF